MSQKDDNGEKTPKKESIAVALEYKPTKETDLPKITASAHGKLAEELLQLAFDKGIKVREDADLATLLSTVELDDDIPSEAIVAVAEVLLHVYKANGDLSEQQKKKLEGDEPFS